MPGTALITGASSGIGAEFARRLAGRGYDLVLVARSADKLQALAAELRSAHHVRAHVIVQDLTAPDAAARIATALDAHGTAVDLLVNNAGFGTLGRFEQIPADLDHDMLMVNVIATVALSHALIPGMVERGSGAVINVGSTAAFNPAPRYAAYGAAKTFVLNFSLALWAEYRGRGVKVLAVCPGPVDTAFYDVVGTRDGIIGRITTAEHVVSAALRALDRDRPYVVPGRSNFPMAHLMPRRPRRLLALVARRVTRSVEVPHTTAAPGLATTGRAG